MATKRTRRRQSPTDPLKELLTLEEAAQLVPGSPALSTLWRWARVGSVACDGEVITLRVARVGRRLCTTKAWLRQFADRLESPEEVA